MSNILRLPPATPVAPAGLADYVAQNDLIYAMGLAIMGASPVDFVNSLIPRGAVFNVGGTVYKASANETITGSASKYVKLTPVSAGAQCDAAYVANLTGVTWSTVYNGYYDGSSNLYLFDEARAVYDGVVTAPKTNLGKLAYLSLTQLEVSGNIEVTGGIIEASKNLRRLALPTDAWNMDSTSLVTLGIGTYPGLTFSGIRSIDVLIYNDAQNAAYPIEYAGNDSAPAGYKLIEPGTGGAQVNVTLARIAGRFFDSTTFNDAAINRGVMLITYEV